MINKAFVLESSSIILAVISVYTLENTFLISYTSYLLALMIIFFAIYISIKKRSKSASELFTGSGLEIYGIVTITLIIILLTGSLASPLFFFLFFIMFFLAFISHPSSIWIFLVALLLYLYPEASNNFNSDTLIKIGSLLLISPIAYFVAKELERRQRLSQRVGAKTDEIIKEAQILKDSTKHDYDEEEALDEIIEEAQSLKKDLNR